MNCLELYGIPKSPQFCLDQLSSNQANFSYPLKHKYDCLSSTQISEEAGHCMGLYYDFKVEQCLQKYESENVVGFQGDKPDEDDHLSYKSDYWKFYSTIQAKVVEIEESPQIDQIIDLIEELEEELGLEQEKEINIKEFLCQNTNVAFITNPYDDEMRF